MSDLGGPQVTIGVGGDFSQLIQDSRDAIQQLLREFRVLDTAAVRQAGVPTEGRPAAMYENAERDLAGMRDLQRFVAAQSELQRRGEQNVFGVHGAARGVDRQIGLRYGLAEEQEFRARDQVQNKLDQRLFAASASAERILKTLGVDPESDLGLRVLKDVLRRERDARETVVKLQQQVANEGEREQQALLKVQRDLRNVLQRRANQEARQAATVSASGLVDPRGQPLGGTRRLVDIESEVRAADQFAQAQDRLLDVQNRAKLGVPGAEGETQAAERLEAAQIRADVAQREAGTTAYIQALAQTTVAERQLRASVNQQVEAARATDPFLRLQEAGNAAQKRLNDALARRAQAEAARTAVSPFGRRLLDVEAEDTALARREAAQAGLAVSQRLAGDDQYITAKAQSTLEEERLARAIRGQVQDAEIGDTGARQAIALQTAQQRLIDALQARANQEARQAATTPLGGRRLVDVESEVRAADQFAAAQDRLLDVQSRARLGVPGVEGETQAAERLETAQIRADVAQREQANDAYITALVQTTVAERQLRASVEQQVEAARGADPGLRAQEAGTAAQRRLNDALARRANALAAERAVTPTGRRLLDVEADDAAAAQREATQARLAVAQRLAGDDQYITAKAAVTVEEKRLERAIRAQVQDAEAADTGGRQAQAIQAAQQRLIDALQARANREAAEAAPGTPGGRRGGLLGLEAEERALTERTRAQAQLADIDARSRLGVNQTLAEAEAAHRTEAQAVRRDVSQRLSANREYISAKAETLASERRLRAAINQEAQQLLSADPGATGLGTRFQRLQAGIASRTGGSPRLPTEFLGLGQFAQSRFLTTAGFAVSGAVLYKAQAQIREMIKEASELQVQFQIVRSTLESTGQTGEAAFREVRDGILSAARATNTIASEVAVVQRQLAGAFASEDLVPDYARAARESIAGLQLARVAGLPTQEITDSLTAITRSFELPEGAFERIGDLITGLGLRFGVAETEIVRFTADLAPLASELGFTAEQLSTLGAAAQQVSGQSGAVLAEQLGRILPGLQQRATEVISIFQNLPEATDLAQAFGANDIARVFEILLGSYDKLNRSQQNQLAALVGGRREAGTFFALLERGDAVLQSLSGSSDQFSGTLQSRFEAASQSVTFAFERLERAVEQLGIRLFEAGIGDALSLIADASIVVVDVVGTVAEIFGLLNDATEGLAAQIIGIAVALRAVAAASAYLAARGGAAGGATALSAALLPSATALTAVPGRGAFLTPAAGASSPIGTVASGAVQTGFLASLFGRGGAAAGTEAQTATGLAAARPAIAAGARRFGTGLATTLRAGIGKAFLPLFVAESARGLLDNLNVGGEGSQAEGALKGAARYGGIGAALGTLIPIPGVSTAAGFAVGSVFGAIKGGLESGGGPKGPDLESQLGGGPEARAAFVAQYQEALEKIAEDDERAARLLFALQQNGLTDDIYLGIRNIVQGSASRQNALGRQVRSERDAARAANLAEEIDATVAEGALSVEQALAAFEVGRATQAEVVAAFAQQADIIRGQIEGALGAAGGPLDITGLQQQLDATNAAAAEFVTTQVNARFDYYAQFAEAFGGEGVGLEAQLAQAQARLSALQAGGADQPALQEAAFAILAIQRDILDQKIEDTEGLSAQIALAEQGILSDVAARTVVVRGLVETNLGGDFQAQIETVLLAPRRRAILDAAEQFTVDLPGFGGLGGGGRLSPDIIAGGALTQLELDDTQFEQIVDEITASLVEDGEARSALLDVALKGLERRARSLESAAALIIQVSGKDSPAALALLAAAAAVRGQIADARAILDDLEDQAGEGTIGADPAELRTEAEGLKQRIAEARLAVERAQANGDQVELAQLALEAAEIQVRFAKDEAARLQALAAVIDARNNLDDAIAGQINDRYDYLNRYIEAFGGEGAGLEAQLGQAQARLAALQAAGADPAVLQDAAFAILDIQRAMLDEEIAATEDTAEQIAIAERGIIADVNARAVVVRGLVATSLGGDFRTQLEETLLDPRRRQLLAFADELAAGLQVPTPGQGADVGAEVTEAVAGLDAVGAQVTDAAVTVLEARARDLEATARAVSKVDPAKARLLLVAAKNLRAQAAELVVDLPQQVEDLGAEVAEAIDNGVAIDRQVHLELVLVLEQRARNLEATARAISKTDPAKARLLLVAAKNLRDQAAALVSGLPQPGEGIDIAGEVSDAIEGLDLADAQITETAIKALEQRARDLEDRARAISKVDPTKARLLLAAAKNLRAQAAALVAGLQEPDAGIDVAGAVSDAIDGLDLADAQVTDTAIKTLEQRARDLEATARAISKIDPAKARLLLVAAKNLRAEAAQLAADLTQPGEGVDIAGAVSDAIAGMEIANRGMLDTALKSLEQRARDLEATARAIVKTDPTKARLLVAAAKNLRAQAAELAASFSVPEVDIGAAVGDVVAGLDVSDAVMVDTVLKLMEQKARELEATARAIAKLDPRKARLLLVAAKNLRAQATQLAASLPTAAGGVGGVDVAAIIGDATSKIEITDAQFEQIVDEITNSIIEDGQARSAMLNMILKIMEQRARNLERTAKQLIKIFGKDSKVAQQLLAAAALIRQQISNTRATVNAVAASVGSGAGAGGKIQGDAGGGSADAETDNLAQRIAEARLALARAQANGDPVRLAQLAIQAAQIQFQFAKDTAERIQALAAGIEAQNQLRAAQADIQQAYLELGAAMSNDPVQQAGYALSQAQLAVSTAQGDAARFRALAQQVSAEEAYRDTIRDVIRSRTELVMAIAQAAGDDVAVAEGALALARAELDRAVSEQAGEAAINDAQRGVVDAQARLRDTQVSSQRDDIEFALEIGQITARQAIAQLQGLLALVAGNEEATEDILSRIHALKEGLGQELHLNLPADLNVEGLVYQARRLTQTREAGVNYQAPQVLTNDYRTYEINLIGNDQAAMAQAVDTIVTAINAPPRTGTYPSLY